MGTTSSSACRSTRVLALAAALFLSGCAGMSETACRGANWNELGERDGMAGLQPRVDQYVHQCSAWNVPVADRAYMTGWQHGKWEYDGRVHRSDCCPP